MTSPMARMAATMTVLLIALSVTSLDSAGAAATTAYNARDALVRARLKPTPLFPKVLPGELECCSAELTRHGKGFSIEYTALEESEPGFIVGFSRSGYRALRKQINFTRHVQKVKVKRIRVGGRKMFYGRGDITFYLGWHAQGFTYMLYSKYYGDVTLGQLRQMAASVAPLGSVYDGTTSQGTPINLYVAGSPAPSGLGFQVGSAAKCTDATTLPGLTEFYGFNALSATGAFVDAPGNTQYSIEDPDTGGRDQITISVAGQIAGSDASGTFSLSSTGSRSCGTGPLTWTARRAAL